MVVTEERGWLPWARHVPSPNEDARPDAVAIDTVVIHHISLPPGYFAGDAIERLFTNRLDGNADPSFAAIATLRVSSHFLIRRHGGLVQFVATDRRAWHAGVSTMLGRQRCNDFSIGIELEGDGERTFTASQYGKLDRLLAELCQRHPLRWVAGHSDIAPGRKSDPGPRFTWARLATVMAATGLVRPFDDPR
jgi:AmpD protein